MTKIEIVSFEEEHAVGAARLLAERHAEHLRAEPLLARSPDWEAEIGRELDGGTGAVAVSEGEIVGYLLGRHVEEAAADVRSGVAGQAARDPEIMGDLYAFAAARWVDQGWSRHVVYLPRLEGLVRPWFRLCFGASGALAAQQAHGTARVPNGPLAVRPSRPDDLESVVALAFEMHEHLHASPSFSETPRVPLEEFRDTWDGIWDDPGYALFVAELDGRVVGHSLLSLEPEPDLRVPEGSVELKVAATDASVRGAGAGVAMTDFLLAWASDHGYSAVITDWRMPNLLASRFWPKRGFRETFLRLFRHVHVPDARPDAP
jgi:GNAT superfamily N-acetyltransferase